MCHQRKPKSKCKIHEKNSWVRVNKAFSNFWYGIKFSYDKVMGNALCHLHLLLLETITIIYEHGFVTTYEKWLSLQVTVTLPHSGDFEKWRSLLVTWPSVSLQIPSRGHKLKGASFSFFLWMFSTTEKVFGVLAWNMPGLKCWNCNELFF